MVSSFNMLMNTQRQDTFSAPIEQGKRTPSGAFSLYLWNFFGVRNSCIRLICSDAFLDIIHYYWTILRIDDACVGTNSILEKIRLRVVNQIVNPIAQIFHSPLFSVRINPMAVSSESLIGTKLQSQYVTSRSGCSAYSKGFAT